MPRLPPHLMPEPPSRGETSALVALLGPTNTGKTYFAIERLLSHRSGMIGLPLRLLAREVYDKVSARVGTQAVALVTGEEKIVPNSPAYWIATVEAMPLERRVDFMAIDEIQLAADAERGRVFTSRLLHARGERETVFLGSATMRNVLRKLFPHIDIQGRERFSALTFSGSKKVSRLPRRTAVVAFSTDTVYALAELVRRQRGGAAVVLGALSPRTRNAQAELYQSGDVDYLIATDAIGMGLNMDIDHVAFAARRKFDGRGVRDLRPDELGQIAGRAGRHVRDGAFGTTADCGPLDEEIVAAIEEHRFEPVEALQWRSETLDFGSLHALKQSLDRPSPGEIFRRAPPGDDEVALLRLAGSDDIRARAAGVASVSLLWDVCQIPDFRKVSIDQHVRLLAEVYEQLVDNGRIAESWLAPRVERLERTDGDIDSLSTRIAFVRTWTYLSNRAGWIENGAYWQQKTRSIEDSLSDALHERLTQRFVDRRTSVLMKKLRDEAPLLAGVAENGDVIVEGQFVGRLFGFEFIVDPRARGPEAKRVRRAAETALGPVLAVRAAALANADADALDLRGDGALLWNGALVAQLKKGPGQFRPDIAMRGLESISPSLRGRVHDRIADYIAARVEATLGDLLKLKAAAESTSEGGLSGLSRGIAFRLVENFGAMSRALVADDLRQLPQEERAKLRNLGVRFGEYTLFMPTLLKPAASKLLTLLWALWAERDPASAPTPKPGLVSIPVAEDMPHAFYYAAGYRPSGIRAVRIDMLERLAGQIRADRGDSSRSEGFEATAQMMSLVGCSGEDFEAILRSLGYRKETVKRRKAPDQHPPAVADGAASPEPEPSDATVEQPAPTVATTPGEGTETEPLQVAAEEPRDTGENPAAPAAETPIGAHAEAVNVEEIEVEVWRIAPRRPPRGQRKPQKGQRSGKPEPTSDAQSAAERHGAQAKTGGERPNRSGPPRGDRGSGRERPEGGDHKRSDRRHGGKRETRYEGPKSFGGRRERGPDPDSPFAILAALKGDLGDKDGR